jgi:hypothetical protein
MKPRRILALCTLTVSLVAASARAGDPGYLAPGCLAQPSWSPCPQGVTPQRQPMPQLPAMPQAQPQPETGMPPEVSMSPDAFAQAPPAGTDAGGSFNPQMIGDLGIYGFVTSPQLIARSLAQPGSSLSTSSSGILFASPGAFASSSPNFNSSSSRIRIPIVGPGSFKITENESPRPMDRVFATYNYFNNANVGGTNGFDIHQQVFGFEKTFMNGDASIGMRLPFIQQPGSKFGSSDIGDLSIVGKFALLNDRSTGNIVTTGLVVTAPTSGNDLNNGNVFPDAVFIQPYGGFIYNMDRLYVQGFSSFIVPTENRLSTIMSNDLGVGFWAMRGDCNSTLRYVIPTLEAHLTTPLSYRGTKETPFGFPDIFIMTGGVHFGLFQNANMTIAVAAPFTGPQPFDYEGAVQFNLRF